MAKNKPSFDDLASRVSHRHTYGKDKPAPRAAAPAAKSVAAEKPAVKKTKKKRSFKNRFMRKVAGLTAISAVLGYGFGAVQTGEFDDPIGAYAETAHDLNTAWNSDTAQSLRAGISNVVNSAFEKDEAPAPAVAAAPAPAQQTAPAPAQSAPEDAPTIEMAGAPIDTQGNEITAAAENSTGDQPAVDAETPLIESQPADMPAAPAAANDQATQTDAAAPTETQETAENTDAPAATPQKPASTGLSL